MRRLLPLVTALALSLLIVLPAQANQTIITSTHAKQVEALLKELGFTGTRIDEDEDVIVMMHGRPVVIIIGSGNGRQLQMNVAFIGMGITLEQVNAWNRNRILAKAYLDRDGDTIFESDLDLDGGITVDRLKDWLQTFNMLIDMFVREVIHGQGVDDPKPATPRRDRELRAETTAPVG